MRVVLFFSACSANQKGDAAKRQVPNSSGRIDEVVVVIDKKAWEGNIGEAARAVLEEEYPGLPQIEPRFDLSHVSPEKLLPLIKRASNIIYFGVTGDPNSTTGREIKARIAQLPADKVTNLKQKYTKRNPNVEFDFTQSKLYFLVPL